jgi:restriction system protein
MTKTTWMVRASDGGRLIGEFKAKNIAAIGWPQVGSLKNVTERSSILELTKNAYPEMSKSQFLSGGSQLARFRNEMQMGDQIVTYDSAMRTYSIGIIAGEYDFNTKLIESLPNFRKVKWEAEVSRDSLSVETKNTLGSTLTLFRLPDEASGEIESILQTGLAAPEIIVEIDSTDEDTLRKDMQSRAHEFIKDKINKLDWEQMQELVAGVLRAMGYKTQVSPAGADRGKDIIASPDGFGFEQPRIIVEVKHRKVAMGSQEIRSFLGGRHKDDKGLYVSTGGFSKDALYEADRASIPLTLMDLDSLVNAITAHYENMDMETRVLVPLAKVYWPA